MKKTKSFFLIALLLLASIQSTAFAEKSQMDYTQQNDTILIPPNSAAILQFDTSNQSFNWIQQDQQTTDNKDVELAVSRAPGWMQSSLLQQLQKLDNVDEYITLLLNAPKTFIDEIAYCIACAPKGDVASPEVLYDNAYWIYEIAKQVPYADIKELNEKNFNYGSTIEYRLLTEEGVKNITYPQDIYYEYVVQPEIEWGDADYIYGVFWREYLWNHNDIGYPLLKEKLQNVTYLWDNLSYAQPANRLWSRSIENHPTAIEAISYWVGKTVTAYATGDRPNQPNIIAHEHNGYCGELRTLATAATRTALIACVPISNLAEDHVWREFYEQGWHQADNWWADTGGTVNQFDVYRYGWGKEMSSVYANNPDDSTYDVTAQYLHPEDRITVNLTLQNLAGDPIDGARIIVLVKGQSDISWLKYKIINIFDQIWDKIPAVISDFLFGWLYNFIVEKITGINDIQQSLVKSTWTITDAAGHCSLNLGPGFNYTFLVQRDTNILSNYYIKKNHILTLKNASEDVEYSLRCVQPIEKTDVVCENKSTGDYFWCMNGSAYAILEGKNARTSVVGNQIQENTSYSSFVVDEENYQLYLKGKSIEAQDMKNGCFITMDTNWYLIVESHQSRAYLSYQKTPHIEKIGDANYCVITAPLYPTFGHIITEVGESIEIHGCGEAITDIIVQPSVNQINWIIEGEYQWVVQIDTSGWGSDEYVLQLISNHSQHTIVAEIFDVQGPKIMIESPEDYYLIENEYLNVSGNAIDKGMIESISLSIDQGSYEPCEGLEQWSASISIADLEDGEHRFTIRAIDYEGNIQTVSQTFVIASENGSGPVFNEVYLNTVEITNTTNVIVYSNCTSSTYTITDISLWFRINDSASWCSKSLHRYADFPKQQRHEEDPLINQSNEPIYGIELGQFQVGDVVSLYVVAKDSSGIETQSEVIAFSVDDE